MYIVRWLMGHPIIAAWVLGILALLLTLGQGQKNKIVEQKSVIMESSEEDSLSTKQEAKLFVNETDKKNQDKNDHQSSIDSVSSDHQAAIKKSVDSNKLSANNVSLVGKADASSATKSSARVVTAGIVSTDLETVNANELLQMAREAFWNNGLDEAADLYEKLIEVRPNVIEYKGELGNIYWRQGYPKKAAGLYLEVAEPMIESGNSERVANMIGFIGLFYPKKAADLSNKLQFK